MSGAQEAPADTAPPHQAPESEPNRADCAGIKGTEYLSHVERAWYLENCLQVNRANCTRIRGTEYLSDIERSWFAANCVTKAAQQRIAAVAPAGAVEAAAAAPEPVAAAEPAPAPQPLSVTDLFIAGYRDAGGAEGHLNRIVNRVIPCESSGNPHAYSTVGPFWGLMQFLPATWNAVGGGDWRDPYQQGANTARLIARANPATQWPVCWFA